MNVKEKLFAKAQRPSPDGASQNGTPFAVLGEDGAPVADDLLPDLGEDDLRALYRGMLLLRAMDSRGLALQRQGRIGFYVPSSGEEALMIGSAHALEEQDWVFPAYRETGVALHRGFPPEKVFAQLYGNEGDLLKGRQMPNHFGSPEHRFAVASSPVGTQIPHAVGAAWAARMRGEPSVAVPYFGDGATSTGDFHTGMNFAAVLNLPVVFICKNNGWAISLPSERQTAVDVLAAKAAGYGMEGVRVDGNDALAVYRVTRAALEKARAGEGPTLVEAVTYRLGPHTTSDDPSRYRSKEEEAEWAERDPLNRMRRFLAQRDLWSEDDEKQAREAADARIMDAVRAVEKLPPPELDTLVTDVYADLPWHLREQLEELRASRGE